MYTVIVAQSEQLQAQPRIVVTGVEEAELVVGLNCSLVGRRTVDGQIFFATLNKNLLALGLGFMNKEKILITTFT
ncbi:hypothetical protein QYF36_001985 [Acer negundo]|nr:hypothetical protein QYF36_001985 [Acer negundo]